MPARSPAFLTFLLCLGLAVAGEADTRYGIAADAKTFPQATPKEALVSALKAVADRRVEYLLAHLADPDFVDDRVKRLYGGRFEEQVADTRARLDARTVKGLERYAEEGRWTVGEDRAVLRLEGEEQVVRLLRKGKVWVLAHNWAP